MALRCSGRKGNSGRWKQVRTQESTAQKSYQSSRSHIKRALLDSQTYIPENDSSFLVVVSQNYAVERGNYWRIWHKRLRRKNKKPNRKRIIWTGAGSVHWVKMITHSILTKIQGLNFSHNHSMNCRFLSPLALFRNLQNQVKTTRI